MPLLHRKLFLPKKPPEDLCPEEKIFYCPLTKEAFRDYDEFYERTILCNSLVWSCSITDRPNLTYQEALDCEASAKNKLSKVSSSILKPILFLVGISNCSRIDDLNDEIYSFVKERYFIDEEVDLLDKSKSTRSPCKIMKVLPTKDSLLNCHSNQTPMKMNVSSSDEEDDKPLSAYKPMRPLGPNDVKYQVRKLFASGETDRVVPSSLIRRKQGIYTRQSSKLLLKANCVKADGLASDPYIVRSKVRSELELNSLEWEDMFTGPMPTFASSSRNSKSKKILDNGTANIKTRNENRLKNEKRKLKQVRESEKEERRKEKEELRKRRAEKLERLKEVAKLDKERKRKEREEESIKLKIEKENIKQQKQEEKKRLAEYLKEWSRPRDDLHCDDLKNLPTPREIHCALPATLFGDVLALLEFFFVFGDLFDIKDEFPQNVTFDTLCDAIMMRNHDSPLCDVLFFFLSNLFRTHSEEEEGFCQTFTEPSDKEHLKELREKLSEERLQAFCTIASTWPTAYQGFPLNKLELDGFTLTEILRLYILTSASRPCGEDRLWRFQHRGGYGVMDDTPLRLCIQHPQIVKKLAYTSVFNLEPEEKMHILLCLLHHLLSFVTPRDFMDDTWVNLQQAQQAYRDDKIAEKRREREFASEKARFRCEQLMLSKQARTKELEEKLRKAELGLDDEVDASTRNLRKRKQADDEEDNIEPKLLSQGEREERLRVFDEEENQAKEAWNYRLNKHQHAINKLQASIKILSLGQDRYYRRYWTISAVAGVFVEEYVDESLSEDMLTLKVCQKKKLFPMLALSGCSTPGMSDSSVAGTPVGINPMTSTSLNSSINTLCRNSVVSPLAWTNAHNVANSIPETMSLTAIEHKNNIPVTINNTFLTHNNHSSPSLKDSFLNNYATSADRASPILSEELIQVDENLTQGKQSRWYVYSTSEEIECLISSLNARGFRESKLRDNLISKKDLILEHLIKSKSHLANIQELTREKADSKVNFKEDDCDQTLETLLRDQILDLEARIWAGTLGAIKVEDRLLWREHIQSGETFEGNWNIEVYNEETPHGDDEAEEVKEEVFSEPVVSFPLTYHHTHTVTDAASVSEDTDTLKKYSIKDLAMALLTVEKGIDKKYIKHPLGDAVDTNKNTRSRTANSESNDENRQNSEKLRSRWETSLVNCTSISQIFLHLSTLERCIMWSKSVLNAKCRICRRKGDAEKMLLCDSCDRGHHMYCLKPALKVVPAGDWFCPDCKPKSSRISPRKVVRTKSFSQDESSDDEEEVADSEEDESGEDDCEDSESLEEEEPIPAKKSTGMTYKIPQKPQRKTPKPAAIVSSKSRPADTKKQGSQRDVDKCTSKRRFSGVWRDLSTCEEILADMIKHKDSWPFNQPVSKKLVPDYYTIIKNPMDLGTVLRKLKNVQYPSPSEFIVDVDQIFLNCHEYNDSRSVIVKTATHLQTFFDSRLHKAGLSHYRLPYNTAKKRRII